MNFWDSSAILPLLVSETSTPAVRALYDAEPEILAWWGTPTECVSALARLEREGALAAALTACEGNPASLPFVCLDQRLSLAAEREGFRVLGSG